MWAWFAFNSWLLWHKATRYIKPDYKGSTKWVLSSAASQYSDALHTKITSHCVFGSCVFSPLGLPADYYKRRNMPGQSLLRHSCLNYHLGSHYWKLTLLKIHKKPGNKKNVLCHIKHMSLYIGLFSWNKRDWPSVQKGNNAIQCLFSLQNISAFIINFGSRSVCHADCTTGVMFCMNVWTYLIDESPESGEDMSEGRFWLTDFKEGQVNVKHFLHQGVVTFAVQQLGLTEAHIKHTHTLTSISCYNVSHTNILYSLYVHV